MGEITMPRLSDTMSEGAVGRWLKKPGDQVEVGEIIAEIETDKATMELEAFEKGTFQKIVVAEGQTVPIGEVIAYIGDGPVEDAPAAAAPPASAAPPAASAKAAPAVAPVAASSGGSDENGRILASPVARRIASELGIDLHLVEGTGPGGRIVKENVEAYAATMSGTKPAPVAPAAVPATPPTPAPVTPTPPAAAPKAPASATVVPMSRMRKAVARAMTEAKPGIPHIYVSMEIDMDAVMALRAQLNDAGAAPVKLSVNDLVVKAVAKTLKAIPAVNTSFVVGEDGQPAIAHHAAINVSVAVALDDGLIAPVIKDADTKSVGTISAEIRTLANNAREGKIKQNEIEGATFQVTNLGMFGVSEFGSIITTPQAASLAVGAVRKIPVVRDDAIVVGQVMTVTLSADHRVVDGAVAAQFLQQLKALLEAPLSILV
ncbi:2-oxo acid dehydrogenase subunit E2 [Candidatus Chloroploca sp. M-50]|uniref:Dihydrolipoamide acetyltransferase component of pyruvate dehydrogenase complex n=1 Tax=Candidatus Chloroploca mongolica TaxID=2528176 RepID=A0ABS4DE58_9CHLR|nr:dihydrolipoamide acetyltransferase family protein [Candidatus Chloroploca mongolica]MBP1467731.1 2-oxo acid dehydrogenase subunit E2 [Candidatus Chloroploca mongolica]